jgi:TonB family protein
MKHDLSLSFILHFLVIMIMLISAPFKPRVRTDLGDVINIRLAGMPAQVQPKAAEPVVIPQAVQADEPVAFVPETKSIDKAKQVAKPKPKKPKEKPYQPRPETTGNAQAGLPYGQKDVTGNLGAASRFGGASVDNASFDYPYWFVQAFSKIERNWSNPVFASTPLTCVIYFQVIRSGKIIKIEVEKSSGIDAFDSACKRAVNASQPLPSLPNEFVDEILGIHLEFPYVP